MLRVDSHGHSTTFINARTRRLVAPPHRPRQPREGVPRRTPVDRRPAQERRDHPAHAQRGRSPVTDGDHAAVQRVESASCLIPGRWRSPRSASHDSLLCGRSRVNRWRSGVGEGRRPRVPGAALVVPHNAGVRRAGTTDTHPLTPANGLCGRGCIPITGRSGTGTGGVTELVRESKTDVLILGGGRAPCAVPL